MTTWQRRLRLALGVFIVLFALGVYLTMRRQPPPPQPQRPVAPLDPKAQLQALRGTYKGLKEGKLDYTIDYDSILEYTADATKIRGVKATFPDRNGRDCQITGDQATVAQDQSSFTVTGNVRFTSSDGLALTAEEATYTRAEDIVRSPGRVEFTKGTMRGAGIGMTYDQKRDILSFADQFEMTAAEKEGEPPSQVHAGSGVWARVDKNMRCEREVKIERGGQVLESDVATAHLTPDEQHIDVLQMQGNSRITTAATQAPGAGGASATSGDSRGRTPDNSNQGSASTLRAMRARDIKLTYTDNGDKLKQALLAGDSSVEVVSGGTDAATRIMGEFIEFGLEPDGATMRTLLARGANAASPARLDMPAQGTTPRRVIRSTTIQGPTPARAKPGPGLTTMRFSENVVYNEAPASPGQLRTATSRVLDLQMQPGFGALEEARFSGNAHLQEGNSLEAAARDARYDVKAGTFEFTGNGDQGGPPFVKDQDQATIFASRIVVRPDSRRVSASGSVQTTIQPPQKRPDGTTPRTPGILSQKQPALAASEELDYDGAASHAVFTSKTAKGLAKLWQVEGNSIYATQIAIDDAKGDLNAKGRVTSAMKLEQMNDKTRQKEQGNTTVSADEMKYVDASRQATYVGHVQMKGGAQGDMKADRAILVLNTDGTALDRLDGYDNVELEDEGTPTTGHRKTTGDRLTYTASDECYRVTGKLVKINEECFGETLCRTLTFYRSVDKMIVDGNAERRTQTKGGQGCKKEPHFD